MNKTDTVVAPCKYHNAVARMDDAKLVSPEPVWLLVMFFCCVKKNVLAL